MCHSGKIRYVFESLRKPPRDLKSMNFKVSVKMVAITCGQGFMMNKAREERGRGLKLSVNLSMHTYREDLGNTYVGYSSGRNNSPLIVVEETTKVLLDCAIVLLSITALPYNLFQC